MDAMKYEFLVRMAYNCGRNFTNGADADIYRKMQREYYSWQGQSEGVPDNRDKLYDYRVAAAKVKSHVQSAINKALSQIYNDTDSAVLSALKAKLHIDEYDKQIIDQVIEEASVIFRKNNLKAM